MAIPSKETRKKVLIVDDDPDLLDMFQMTLENAGYEVETASSGHAALRTLKNSLPDAIILDLMMPDCSGFDVLLSLQEGTEKKPPIIVVSGVHQDANTVDRVRKEPIVFDFLFKPVKPDLVVDTVRRAISAA